MKLQPLHLVVLSLLASACIITIDDDGASFTSFASFQSSGHGPRHVGSGHLAVEQRTTEPFTGLVMQGSLNVEVVVAPDLAKGQIEISGDDNLLGYVRTEVREGQLIVDLEEGNYRMKKPLIVRARTASLDSVELDGSGDISVSGLDNAAFDVRLDGSGDIDAKGRTAKLNVALAGSGDIDLGRLVAGTASVALVGSGDIRLHAKDDIAIELVGSGDVGYRGQPGKIKVRITGSGDIYRFD